MSITQRVTAHFNGQDCFPETVCPIDEDILDACVRDGITHFDFNKRMQKALQEMMNDDEATENDGDEVTENDDNEVTENDGDEVTENNGDEATENDPSEEVGSPAKKSRAGKTKQRPGRTVTPHEDLPYRLSRHEKVGPPSSKNRKVRIVGAATHKVRRGKQPQKVSLASRRQVSPGQVADPSTLTHTPPQEPMFAVPASFSPTSPKLTSAPQEYS